MRIRFIGCRRAILALALLGSAALAAEDELAALKLRPSLSARSQSVATADAGADAAAMSPGSGAGKTGFVSSNAPVRRARATENRASPPAVPRQKSRAEPERRRRIVEDDPFAAVGVRVGSFLVKPSVEIAGGYDDNPFRTDNGRGSRLSVVEGRILSKSEWTRHELETELRGAYTKYYDVGGNDRPLAEAKLRGRIDVSGASRVELEARAMLSTEDPGSPDAVTGVRKPPPVYSYGARAGLVQRFNRLEAGVHGSVERNTYADAQLLSGGTVDQSDRNYTAYGARVRAGYEITPDAKPFVEVGADQRVFDRDVDFSGVRRGSDGLFARAGMEFGREGRLTGEASAGWMQRTYQDPTLEDVAGLIFDASLVWRASGLTKVTWKANSEIGETMLAGASGVFKREARVIVDHALRRWLIGSLSLGYAAYDYEGIARKDERTSLAAALTYHLNRSLALKGELRRERLRSSVPGQDYTANIALIGLKWQR